MKIPKWLRRLINFLKIAFFASIIVFLIYWFFTTPSLKVETINVKNVSGESFSYVQPENIIRSLRYIIGEHLLFVDDNEIINFVEDNFDYVDEVFIQIEFPSVVSLNIIEKDLVGNLYQSGSEPLVIDQKGEVLNRPENYDKTGKLDFFVVSEAIYSNYIVASIRYKDIFGELVKFQNTQNFINKDKLSSLISSYREFGVKENSISYFVYFPIENEMHMILSNSTALWLDIGDNFNEQWEKVVNSQQLYFEDINRIKYIDFRVNEKLIICYEGEECQNNPHYQVSINPELINLRDFIPQEE